MKLKDGFFCLENTTTADGETHCDLRLDACHPIYRAHFPGNPITPGVCLIQLVAELLEGVVGRQLALKRIVNVKFQHVLSPVEHPTCRVTFRSIEPDGGVWKVRAVVRAAAMQFAQLSMIFEESANDAPESR